MYRFSLNTAPDTQTEDQKEDVRLQSAVMDVDARSRCPVCQHIIVIRALGEYAGSRLKFCRLDIIGCDGHNYTTTQARILTNEAKRIHGPGWYKI